MQWHLFWNNVPNGFARLSVHIVDYYACVFWNHKALRKFVAHDSLILFIPRKKKKKKDVSTLSLLVATFVVCW